MRHTYLPPSQTSRTHPTHVLRITVRTTPVCLRALTVSRANVSRALRCTNPLTWEHLWSDSESMCWSAGRCPSGYAQSLLQFVMFKCSTACIHVAPMKPRISCLRDYHPVPLTPVIMRCLGLLVKTHIDSFPLGNLDSLHRANRSTAIAFTPHYHIRAWRAYMWDYSTAFNIILRILTDHVWEAPCAIESWTCWQADWWRWRLTLPPLILSTADT